VIRETVWRERGVAGLQIFRLWFLSKRPRFRISSFAKLQNIPELKAGHAKIFNFSPKTYKLSNSISRDSGDSPDSNHTKYVNYECLDLKEIGVIFPSLRDA
jgi:hypothetical protein